MIKLHFKTTGYEPDIQCVEPCQFDVKPTENTMIGSASCQQCAWCYGWDSEENWVKCLKYASQVSKGLIINNK